MRGVVKIGYYAAKLIFIDFAEEEDLKGFYHHIDKVIIFEMTMRLMRWSKDFKHEEETTLLPIWVLLRGLKWHHYHWDALKRITSPIGTLFTIYKATVVKSRPKFSKVKIEIDLNG